MKRERFTFYRSYFDSIADLPTVKEKYQAYQMLCDYCLNKTEPDLKTKKPFAAFFFQLVYPALKRRYEAAEQYALEEQERHLMEALCGEPDLDMTKEKPNRFLTKPLWYEQ